MKLAADEVQESSQEDVEIANEHWCVYFSAANVNCRNDRCQPEAPETAQAKDRDMWLVIGISIGATLVATLFL